MGKPTGNFPWGSSELQLPIGGLNPTPSIPKVSWDALGPILQNLGY